VLPKPARDQRPSLRGQFNLPDTPVARAIVARGEIFFDQAIDRHADGARREPDFRAERIYRERSFVKERLKHAKIRVAQLGSPDALGGVRHQSLEGFHQNEPDVNSAGILRFGDPLFFHKVIIDSDYIDVNILEIKQRIIP